MNELTADCCVRALVYKDHMGRGWYAYLPMPDDSLDAEGAIPARCYDTQREAEAAVLMALRAAGSRPHDTAIRMESQYKGRPIW